MVRISRALVGIGLIVGCVGCQPAATQSTTAGASPRPSPSNAATTTPGRVSQPQAFALFVKAFYVGASGYQIQLVGADGKIAASTTARNRSFKKNGLVDLPVTSTTSTKVYYLDGDSDIRYMTSTGQTGSAYHIAITGDQLASFAVTPDDLRIAATVIDYASEPPTMRLFTDDLAGGHKVELFSSSRVYEWPVGWHQGHLVLAVSPLASVQNAGEWYMGSRGFHIVEAASGNRLLAICEDLSADTPFPTSPWGGTCQIYPNVANLVSWDGVKREVLVDRCRAIGPPSPDGSRVAVRGMDGGCATATNAPIRVIDSSGRVNVSTALGVPLGWLDNSHLIFQEDLPPFSAANAVAPIKILELANASAVVVDASGFFAGDLPGGLG